jgi:hypothetical protein
VGSSFGCCRCSCCVVLLICCCCCFEPSHADTKLQHLQLMLYPCYLLRLLG